MLHYAGVLDTRGFFEFFEKNHYTSTAIANPSRVDKWTDIFTNNINLRKNIEKTLSPNKRGKAKTPEHLANKARCPNGILITVLPFELASSK